MDIVKKEYRYNLAFRKYVDEYCNKNKCTVDEALNDKNVRRMFWRYTEI